MTGENVRVTSYFNIFTLGLPRALMRPRNNGVNMASWAQPHTSSRETIHRIAEMRGKASPASAVSFGRVPKQ